jgi:hypothetical protein
MNNMELLELFLDFAVIGYVMIKLQIHFEDRHPTKWMD